jgi:hypothetical protein
MARSDRDGSEFWSVRQSGESPRRLRLRANRDAKGSDEGLAGATVDAANREQVPHRLQFEEAAKSRQI